MPASARRQSSAASPTIVSPTISTELAIRGSAWRTASAISATSSETRDRRSPLPARSMRCSGSCSMRSTTRSRRSASAPSPSSGDECLAQRGQRALHDRRRPAARAPVRSARRQRARAVTRSTMWPRIAGTARPAAVAPNSAADAAIATRRGRAIARAARRVCADRRSAAARRRRSRKHRGAVALVLVQQLRVRPRRHDLPAAISTTRSAAASSAGALVTMIVVWPARSSRMRPAMRASVTASTAVVGSCRTSTGAS